MAGGFTKLFSSIVTSSIWCQDDVVLRVWIAMLATCDASGIVEGSIPGFASMSRVTNEQMERAIEVLSSPDEYSRTKDKDGRRVEGVEGGWRIINYLAYRDKGQAKEGSRAPYMRNRRACRPHSNPVTDRNALHDAVTSGTEAEAEAEKEVPPNPQGGTAKAAKRPRRSRVEILQPFGPDVVRVVNTLLDEWKSEDPEDGRPIKAGPEDMGKAVDSILKAYPNVTPDMLIQAGRDYLASPRIRYKAPQYFFGPQGPWDGFIRAQITAQEVSHAV